MTEVKDLVHMIQNLFPKFKVEESNIVQPTSEFVVQFYNLVLNEFQDIIFLLAVGNPNEETNHEEILFKPEEICFEISKIFNTIKFKLSDIYQPNFVKTKNFIRMILHFHTFSLELSANLTPLLAEIIRKRENLYILVDEKLTLKEIITENATRKANCIDEDVYIAEKLSTLDIAYSEMEQKKAKRNEIFKEMEKQIQELTQSIELENLSLTKEENERDNLTEHIVTETEYNNILEIRESLKNELKSLDEDHTSQDEALSIQEKTLKHHEDCRKTLPDISKLHSLENVARLIQSKEMSNDLKIKLDKLADTKNKASLELKQDGQKYNDISSEFESQKTEYYKENNDFLEKKEKILQSINELKQISEKRYIFEESVLENKTTLMNIKKERLELLTHICLKFKEIMVSQKENYSKCYAALNVTKKP